MAARKRKSKRSRSAVGRKIRKGATTRARKRAGKSSGGKRTPRGITARVKRLEGRVGVVEKRVDNVENWTLRSANVLRKHAGRPALKTLSGSPSKGIPSSGKGF